MRYNSLWKKIFNLKKVSESINPYDSLETVKEYKSDNKKIIEIENVTQIYKSFKKENVIYRDLNLDFYEGESVALLGPNGAGKTTLVETICGTKKPTSGNIKYNYEFGNNPYENIGMQFQDLKFPSSLSVKDIIEFILDLSSLREIDPNELNELLVIFHLKDILNIRASKLSGGQQQRLNVFLSLIHKPKILLLDEFTTGLDIAIKNSIQFFIKKYAKENKITLILISHDIDAIANLSERIVVLASGQIKIDLSREQIDKKFGSLPNLLYKYIAY